MIRATLERFDVTFDVWQSERALHDAGDVDETLRALDGQGLHRPPRRRRLAEDDGAVGRRQGPRGREVRRAADVSARGHRLPPQEAGARLRRAHRHLGLRPPRPHRAHAGGAEGVRVRSGRAARDPDPERQPAARRGRGEDGEAGGGVRHAGRRRRRGRARRDPLLLPDAPPRHPAGVRPGGRQAAVDGQPGLLRPVRARALRRHPAPGGGAGSASGYRSMPPWRRSWRCPRRSRSCAGWPTSPTSWPTRPPPASPTA